MLQFTLITERRWDGVDASIPSIAECETWAADEDEAIELLMDRLAFFLQREPGFKYALDYMRREDDRVFYKLILKDGK